MQEFSTLASSARISNGAVVLPLTVLLEYLSSRAILLATECADPALQHKNLRLIQGGRLELLSLQAELEKVNVQTLA